MKSLGNATPSTTPPHWPVPPRTHRPSLFQRLGATAVIAQPTQGNRSARPLVSLNRNDLQAGMLTSWVVNHFLTDDDRRAFSQVNRIANQSVNSDATFVFRNYRAQMAGLRQALRRAETESDNMRHSQRPVVQKFEAAAEAIAGRTGVNYQAYPTRQAAADARVQNLRNNLKSLRSNYVLHSIHMLDGRPGANRAVPHLAAIHNLQGLLTGWDAKSHEVRMRELLAAEQHLVGVSDQVATASIAGAPMQRPSGSGTALHDAIWWTRSNPHYHPELRNRLEELQDRLIHLELQDSCAAIDQPLPSQPAEKLVVYHDAPNEPWHAGKNIVFRHTDPDTGVTSTREVAWPKPSEHTAYVRCQFPTVTPGRSFTHVYAVNKVSVMEEPDG